ncbi:MAG: 2-amino-4-hydroxy-6-hydroxymethyldihydropteridine diphosphokinase [Bacteroidetes bacterium]|nr:MAG: 2-amino-4-hydroxy-6-hydroxymethyldihydropteridine diphosphokinase [Bacteroidota bacterium]
MSDAPHTVYLSLGSNLGDREALLDHALDLLRGNAGTIAAVSGTYETEPWPPGADQPMFLNLAAELVTQFSPEELMTRILQVEQVLGRVREKKWAPRTIDIDILFFDDRVIHSDTLHIPHPHIAERAFVLEPLYEIAPDFTHPEAGETVSEMLRKYREQPNRTS